MNKEYLDVLASEAFDNYVISKGTKLNQLVGLDRNSFMKGYIKAYTELLSSYVNNLSVDFEYD